MKDVNILEALFSNPGLCHVAEHVISFLDDKSVAQYRLVSKTTCELLDNIWRDRMLQAARQLCQKKFEVYEWTQAQFFQSNMEDLGPIIQRCIFELWPDWKNALLEIKRFEDLNVVIYLLRQYFTQWESSSSGFPRSLSRLVYRISPLHFAAEHFALFEEKESSLSLKIFKILLETSLDFSVMYCIDEGTTPFLHACQVGSKEVVKLLLDNAVKKGIEMQTFTPNGSHLTAVNCGASNDDAAVVKHLFERRNEFDFDVSYDDLNTAAFEHSGVEVFEIILKWLVDKGVQVDEEYEDRNVLHFACEHNSEAALFLLQNYEKFGIERSVVLSMTNSTDNENNRPIDLARGNIWALGDQFTERLIQELENFT